MRRGTTPIHEFEIPLEVDKIKTVKITYSQNDKVVLEKRTEDCKIEVGKISTKLTQEETFEFSCSEFAEIQLRALTVGDDCLESDVIYEPVEKCLDDEVLK